MEYGKVYLVPTPIGNLKDITLRALEVLENVDEIAAEDTRQTLKLLNHFNIKKPLFSYHQHNEQGKSDEIVSKLELGKNIAIVTDAGTPGISDPGSVVVRKCIENNIAFEEGWFNDLFLKEDENTIEWKGNLKSLIVIPRWRIY